MKKKTNGEIQRDKEINSQVNEQTKANLQRQDMQVRERIADKQVQVATINKNKYDKK